MTPVWYQVRDLAAGREFYKGKLGFAETYVDSDGSWVKLERDGMEIGLAEGRAAGGLGVAHVDVQDVKAVAEELRKDGVEVGVVFELHGEMRLARRVRSGRQSPPVCPRAFRRLRSTLRQGRTRRIRRFLRLPGALRGAVAYAALARWRRGAAQAAQEGVRGLDLVATHGAGAGGPAGRSQTRSADHRHVS